MGQAKQRGTFEQRKQAAVEREAKRLLQRTTNATHMPPPKVSSEIKKEMERQSGVVLIDGSGGHRRSHRTALLLSVLVGLSMPVLVVGPNKEST